MDKQKLQPLKGFRDFLPEEARKREYLIEKFRNSFELFGFEPLITPSLEYQELLLNKYGEEADKLVYKFTDEGGRNVALRYDQTVPTSRILAMYRDNLPMPWRRYQIQTVWRAEKPQKGRFREFTQVDVDIFNTTSLLSDAELLALAYTTLKNLSFEKFSLKINDRAILFEILNNASIPDEKQFSVIQSIDKLDKFSREHVEEELLSKGFSVETVHKIFEELDSTKPTENLNTVINLAKELGVPENVLVFDPNLARGLDYYTSVIYEFVIDGYEAGSVAGGGRYDNLIRQLSGFDIPATGFSFGFDRVLEAMDQFNLFQSDKLINQVLVTIFNNELIPQSAQVAKQLRDAGINAELFPDETKDLKKQLKYADKKGIKWLIVIGPDEAKKETVVLKDLKTGHQEDIPQDKLLDKLK